MHVGYSDIILAVSPGKETQMPTSAAIALDVAPSSSQPFPVAALETTLRAELLEAVKAEAEIRGVKLPSAAADIGGTAFQLDSLVVVSILCAVEPVVGLELPDSVVRAGGYTSIDSAVGQLMPRIEALWKKWKGSNS